MSSIADAIRNDEKAFVKGVISGRCPPEITDNMGRNALFFATTGGEAIVLIAFGVSFMVRDERGRLPIDHHRSFFGSRSPEIASILRYFMENPADASIDWKNPKEMDRVFQAVEAGFHREKSRRECFPTALDDLEWPHEPLGLRETLTKDEISKVEFLGGEFVDVIAEAEAENVMFDSMIKAAAAGAPADVDVTDPGCESPPDLSDEEAA